MNARRFTRLGLVASGFAVAATLAFAGNAQADPVNSGVDNGSMVSGSGTPAQQFGCERTKKPTCNRPGRRSTHR
jgi:hypothetical protein